MPHRKISDRLLASIVSTEDGTREVDVGLFAEQLLFFDEVTLNSSMLIEIPPIAAAFGYRNTRNMLESDILRISYGPATTGETGRKPNDPYGPKLPDGHYHLAAVCLADHKLEKVNCLSQIQSISGLTSKETNVIKSMVGSRFQPPPVGIYKRALAQTTFDVTDEDGLLPLATTIKAKLKGIQIDESDLVVSATFDDGVYQVQSNLGEVSGLSPDVCNNLLQGGLLAIASMNTTIEDMSRNNAITAFRDAEVALYQQKFGKAVVSRTSETRIADFSRVVQIAGLPNIREAAQNGTLNYERLLELRNTAECKEFRGWLRQTAEMSDAEVKCLVSGFSVAANRIVNSPLGGALRYIVPGILGSGIFGDTGALAALTLGALDMFLLSRLLPARAPLAFIYNSYPSLFRS